MDSQLLESRQYLEQQILGTAFLDETLVPQMLAVLKPDMFVIAQHRNLLKMIDRLVQKREQVSPVTIASNFGAHLESIGGMQYLTELVSGVISTRNVEYNLKKLIELHARQKLNQLLEETKQLANDPAAAAFEELLDDFERKCLEIRPKVLQERSTVDDIIDWYEKLVQKKENPNLAFGMMTGWDELDRMTLGWQRSDFVVIGARTSMGKSAFAIENALRVSRRGHKVAIFSLEMTKEQIYNRMIGNLAHITLQELRIGKIYDEQLAVITTFMDQIKQIQIDDTRAVTAEYISSEMRRLKRQEGLDLVIIDYLQEIKEPNERNDNTGSGLHRVCQKLRSAGKDCDCAVIGLSQVKREVEQRANKRPFSSDLYGSAAIEAVADGIVLLYRDEYYDANTSDRGILEVNLAKQRNGPTGTVKLVYNKDFQKITSMTGRSTPA